MKIGIFTEVYRPIINGVVASVESLTEELRARGHEAYTFAPRIPNGVEAIGRVFFMPSLPLPARTEYRLTVPLVARRNKARFLSQCDVIHSHSLFVTGWMAQYYARYRIHVSHDARTIFALLAARKTCHRSAYARAHKGLCKCC